MNKAFKFAPIFLITLAGTLSSCQNQNALAPSSPNSLLTPPLSVTGSNPTRVSVQRKYILSKHGNNILAYYPNGKLQRVSNSGGTDHIEYAYPSLSVVVASYFSGPQLNQKITYSLNMAGRAYKANFKLYEQGVLQLNRDYSLLYDTNGQLVKTYDTVFPAQHEIFTYNLEGDLIKIDSYDSNGTPWRVVTFDYQVGLNLPIVDRYPLHFNFIQGVDPYLTIFGQPSKHLCQHLLWKTMPSNVVGFDWNFAYQRNTAGYVTERKMAGSSSKTSIYIY